MWEKTTIFMKICGRLICLCVKNYEFCKKIDDAKKSLVELFVDTNGRRHWLCLETNLLVLFFSKFIVADVENCQLNSLSIKMDEGVGFVQRRTYNKI